jgi:Predicted membrane protein
MNIDHQIVVVDDNSPDGTAQAVERLSKQYRNIILVKRPGKNGIATAIRDGLLNSESKYVIVMDSDLQHPPEVIPKLYRQLRNGNDMAVASRYVRGGKTEFGIMRRMVSKVATFLAHVNLTETEGIMDPMSGYFGFKRDIISPSDIKSNGYKIFLEILVAAKKPKVVEVPYRFNRRASGKSKLGAGEFVKYIKLLLNLSDYLMVKFLIVGVLGAIINLLMMKILVGGLGEPIFAGAILALEAGIVSSFCLNNYWTYRKRKTKGTFIRKYVRYNLMSVLGSAIYFALIVLLASFGINYMLATGIGVVASFSTNFAGGGQGVIWHL